MFFQCHHIPKNFRIEVNSFLKQLVIDDTFSFELEKIKPSLQFIEINFIDSNSIQELNKKFRDIDHPTDVLSFNLQTVGEIDLCLDIIKINSEDNAADFLEEIFRCIIHGCLHILGYDHVEKLNPQNIHSEPMFLLQEKILNNVASSSLSKI